MKFIKKSKSYHLLLLFVILCVSILFFLIMYKNKKIKTSRELILDNMKHKLDNPKYTKFVDKLEFKEYCKSKGIKTPNFIKSWNQDDYKDIDLYDLYKNTPCVLKSTKGSGRNIILKDTNDINYSIFDKIKYWGEIHNEKEPQYEHIIPRIFIEDYIDPFPEDIKVYMLNGKIKMIGIHKTDDIIKNKKYMNFYDSNFNKLDCKRTKHDNFTGRSVLDEILDDNNGDKLLDTVYNLANHKDLDLDFYRIDLYYHNGEFMGGEMTLSPHAGKLYFYGDYCNNNIIESSLFD